jgi:hypothetical protein
LAGWRASGETLEGYARQLGTTAQRLRWWRRRLREWAGPAGEAAEALQLVPVTAPAAASMTETVSVASAVVHLPGGVVVELDTRAVAPGWVAQLAWDVARGR